VLLDPRDDRDHQVLTRCAGGDVGAGGELEQVVAVDAVEGRGGEVEPEQLLLDGHDLVVGVVLDGGPVGGGRGEVLTTRLRAALRRELGLEGPTGLAEDDGLG
jgi:hypothetical protein